MDTATIQNTGSKTNLARALESAENLFLFVEGLEFPSEENFNDYLEFAEQLEPNQQNKGAWASSFVC